MISGANFKELLYSTKPAENNIMLTKVTNQTTMSQSCAICDWYCSFLLSSFVKQYFLLKQLCVGPGTESLSQSESDLQNDHEL